MEVPITIICDDEEISHIKVPNKEFETLLNIIEDHNDLIQQEAGHRPYKWK